MRMTGHELKDIEAIISKQYPNCKILVESEMRHAGYGSYELPGIFPKTTIQLNLAIFPIKKRSLKERVTDYLEYLWTKI